VSYTVTQSLQILVYLASRDEVELEEQQKILVDLSSIADEGGSFGNKKIWWFCHYMMRMFLLGKNASGQTCHHMMRVFLEEQKFWRTCHHVMRMDLREGSSDTLLLSISCL
jgi:hypothetical protein